MIGRPRQLAAADQRAKIQRQAGQGLHQNAFKQLAFGAIDQFPRARIGHKKCVKNNPVLAAEDLCAQNVDSRGGEGTGDLAEQSRAVPGAHFHDCIAAVRFVVPVDDRLQRFFFFGNLMMHESMRLGQVGRDCFGFMNLEVPRRQSGEMSFDFIFANAFWHEAADLFLQKITLPLLGANEIRPAEQNF